jgi:hypothetical protein
MRKSQKNRFHLFLRGECGSSEASSGQAVNSPQFSLAKQAVAACIGTG